MYRLCLSELGLLEDETNHGEGGEDGDRDDQLAKKSNVAGLAVSSTVVGGEGDVLQERKEVPVSHEVYKRSFRQHSIPIDQNSRSIAVT